jgi:hypothetical protein
LTCHPILNRAASTRRAFADGQLLKCDSSGLECDVQKLGGGFSMLKALGDHSKSESLHTGNRLIAVHAIIHHAGQARHFGQPAAVFLTLKFDRKDHDRYCTIRPAV